MRSGWGLACVAACSLVAAGLGFLQKFPSVASSLSSTLHLSFNSLDSSGGILKGALVVMLLSGLRLSSASKARSRTLQTWAETIAFRSRTTAPTKLYSAWFCPYSQCTFAQLEELADHGFTYQYIEIDPYKPRPDGLDSKQKLSIEEKRKKYPEFVKASPQGLVPAMTHKRASVWGCADCSLYLVDLLERNPSLSTTTGGVCMDGTGSEERARVWAFWELCQSRIVPFFYRALMLRSAAEQQSALDSMLAGMREANAMMAQQSPSGFFLGEQYSVADLSLAPWWQRLPLLQHYRGFQVPDEDEYARLKGWWEAVQSRPSYQRTMVDVTRLIENYREYADGTATSTVANTFVHHPAASKLA